MLISCEKCSTTYVLDDALIPPQGAPVQCTRCGHVFTARVQALEPTPQPPSRAGSSTMMFGNNPPPAPAKNTTMMFGAGTTPTAPQPNPRSTMVFGAGAAVPPAPQAQPAGRATMVFGASPVAAPPAKNQTMAFGTPAAPAAPQPPPNVRTTMMFAGGGAPTPAAAQPAVSKNQTMVFGTAASNAAPPPAAAGSMGRTTVMFGAHSPTEPNVEAPAEETQLDSQGPGNRTMMFGNPNSAAADAAVNKNSTMMFGRPPPQSVTPKVSAADVQLAGYAADENAPNERTVRVDVDEIAAKAALDANDSSDKIEAPSRHDSTQRFAMTDGQTTPPEGQLNVQARHDRTQLFAMKDESTAPDGRLADDASDLNATLPPGDMNVRRVAPLDIYSTLPPDDDSAPEGAGVSTFYDPANGDGAEARPAFAAPVSTTIVNGSALHGNRSGSGRVDPVALEMEHEGKVTSPLEGITQPQQAVSPEELAAVRAARSGGAGRVVVVILALVALVLAAVLVYRLFPGLFSGGQRVGAVTQSVQSLLG